MKSRLAAVALVLLVAGCRQGGSPSAFIVQVANESSTTAELSWQSPGLFGTNLFPSTGTDPVGGCAIYETAFGPGHNVVRITLNGNSLQLSLDATSSDQQERYVLIDAEGNISEVDAASMPADPCSYVSPS